MSDPCGAIVATIYGRSMVPILGRVPSPCRLTLSSLEQRCPESPGVRSAPPPPVAQGGIV